MHPTAQERAWEAMESNGKQREGRRSQGAPDHLGRDGKQQEGQQRSQGARDHLRSNGKQREAMGNNGRGRGRKGHRTTWEARGAGASEKEQITIGRFFMLGYGMIWIMLGLWFQTISVLRDSMQKRSCYAV